MLDRLPYEVLENIAFWVGYIHYPSSSSLLSIFLLNRSIHDELLGAPEREIPANHALLARLFEENFDKQALERRFGLKLTSSELAAEYKKRVGVLRRMTRQDPTFDDLWTVLLMIYEDDGKNMLLLRAAEVEDYATRAIPHTRNDVDEHNWPRESDTVQLLLAIISLVSSVESVAQANPELQELLLDTMDPFVYAPHQYSSALFHITHFGRHGQATEDSDLLIEAEDTPHATGTIRQAEVCRVEHFGRELRVTSPPAAGSALRATLLRKERHPVGFLPKTPRNRAEADAAGRTGATQEDYALNNLHRAHALGSEVPHAGSMKERANLAGLPNPLQGSRRFDQDFWRLFSVDWDVRRVMSTDRWFNTVYIPGILTGKWFGRLMMPDFRDFTNMVGIHPDKPELVDLVAQPFQLCLREHVATDILQFMSKGTSASGDGVLNGWLPDSIDISHGRGGYETADGLRLIDPSEPDDQFKEKYYRSFATGVHIPPGDALPLPPKIGEDIEMDFVEESNRRSSPDDTMDDSYDGSEGSESDDGEPQFVDVMITGETSYSEGMAWGAYTVYGRVRSRDGLIMLVRVPRQQDGGGGRWIFSGHLSGATTILGQWRSTGTAMNAVGYSGPFMLTKLGDTYGLPPLH